jgi:serine/threonine protein kinase/dienelactone hydrolase
MKTTRDEEIFSEVMDLPADARGARLDEACGADEALRRRVEALLQAHDGSDRFLRCTRGPGVSARSEEQPGAMVGRYKLLQRIGEGGCGVVWMAEQEEPVRRRVALKVIKLGMDTKSVVARFEAERQALAMMDHPNIAKVLDAGATDAGRPFFVMELVRGISITRYCDENQLTPRARLELFIKVCRAIQHAHEKAIIHRDLKPANILVTLHDGVPVPKVIDFGIAKATRGRLTDQTLFTAFEQFIGTPVYMSPEQAELSGLDVDSRSDLYSLGVLLYELLTGRPPFDPKAFAKAGVDEIRQHIREGEPPRPSTRLSTLGEEERSTVARQRGTVAEKLSVLLRGDLDWVVMRCLEKDRTRRYETANGLAADIERHLRNEPVIARPPSSFYLLQKLIRRHRVGFTAASLVIAVVVVGAIVTAAQATRALRAERTQNELREAARQAEKKAADAGRTAEQEAQRSAKIRWAREQALPEINRLIRANDIAGAFALARQAEEHIPEDPALTSLWPQISAQVTVETVPGGADIYIKPYRKPSADWEYIGKSPLKGIRLARDVHRWQVRKEGYATVERTDGWYWANSNEFRVFVCHLVEERSNPPGMVLVHAAGTLPPSKLGDYFIDKFEVTNREFKVFVDGGGYASEKFWKNAFVKEGEVLSWSAAMALFRDATGSPGPSTWSNGSYAEGEADFPVTGVSWFEAAAFAEFTGKQLPTFAHWREAASIYEAEFIFAFSNFSRRGLLPVGRSQGMSVSGAFDMAGNAKEWCWNEAGGGRRCLMGGAWDEPEYVFRNRETQSPFDRSKRNGFRCIKLTGSTPLPDDIFARFPAAGSAFGDLTPVGDAQFQGFRRLFEYDKANLNSTVEAVDDANPRWRKEKVSFNAAYNAERMTAVIFLPRNARPPYQTIIYFPGAGAWYSRSSDELSDMAMVETLLQTRRAVIYPVLKGSHERQLLGRNPARNSVAYRDWQYQLGKDVRRTIDYLETRTDIQTDKVAFFGFSWGGNIGPLVAAVEDRIKVSVLAAAGFNSPRPLAEVDGVHFAPRVTIPILMINGRGENGAAQKRMFDLLGTLPEHKRQLLIEGAHGISLAQATTEIMEWLDRYLGPVK